MTLRQLREEINKVNGLDDAVVNVYIDGQYVPVAEVYPGGPTIASPDGTMTDWRLQPHGCR